MNTATITRQWKESQPARRIEATSSDGTRIAVQEWGNPNGPAILFAHAWAQSHLGWAPQLSGPLADTFRLITFDQRGHGESGRPTDIESYTDNELWADDIAAVIEAAELVRPVIVGWSLGGVGVLDYVAKYGQANIAGINFVAAGNTIGTERAFSHFGTVAASQAGPSMSTDLRVQLDAVLRLQQALVYRDVPLEEFGELVMQAVASSPTARAGWLSRNVDHEWTLRSLNVPVLFTHGTADQILTIAATHDARSYVGHGHLSTYDAAGHAPHLEDPDRFDSELAAFRNDRK
jgi:non-heme chloroperoxidase